MKNYPKSWYPILHIKEITKKPFKIEVFSKNIVLWRDGDSVIAMDNRCPHRGVELSAGKICNGAIVCPFHGLEFDTNGSCRFAPEVGRDVPKLKTTVYPTKIIADMIWINVFEQDIDSSYAFEFAQKEYDYFDGKYSMITDIWNNNIRHCIENQLDYTHLGTVHKRTIGRNYKYPKNVEVIANDKTIEALNDGKLMLKYVFPNIWQLSISDQMRIGAYFVPINDFKTKIYIINYRKFMTAQFVKQFMDLIFMITSRIILNEDKRIVKTQKFDENYHKNFLFKNDQIIKEFRKIWN